MSPYTWQGGRDWGLSTSSEQENGQEGLLALEHERHPGECERFLGKQELENVKSEETPNSSFASLRTWRLGWPGPPNHQTSEQTFSSKGIRSQKLIFIKQHK